MKVKVNIIIRCILVPEAVIASLVSEIRLATHTHTHTHTLTHTHTHTHTRTDDMASSMLTSSK